MTAAGTAAAVPAVPGADVVDPPALVDDVKVDGGFAEDRAVLAGASAPAGG
jgi:hypothetical protein